MEVTDSREHSTRSPSSPTHLTVEQLFPAALRLGWLTRKREKEKIVNNEDRGKKKEKKKKVHYLLTLFVQEEVNY